MVREEWLLKAVTLLRPWFVAIGLEIPETVHVSVGFPSKGGLSRKAQRAGECWHAKISADNNHQIFINPTIADGSRALDVLLHELIHAALPDGVGHKAPFAKAAKQLGLDGKPKATIASEALRERLQRELLALLGDYPHPALNPVLVDMKKQTTRLIKVVCAECQVDGRPYTVRMSRMAIDVIGAPICPACERRMVTPDLNIKSDEPGDESGD